MNMMTRNSTRMITPHGIPTASPTTRYMTLLSSPTPPVEISSSVTAAGVCTVLQFGAVNDVYIYITNKKTLPIRFMMRSSFPHPPKNA